MPTDYKTLDEKYVAPVQFKTIWDARNWIKKYDDIEGFEFFGNTNFLAQYAVEEFGYDIDYDMDIINVGKYDIETESDGGFPDINDPKHKITSIAYTDNSHIYYVWGLKGYDVQKSLLTFPLKENIKYIQCDTEKELIESFIAFWVSNPPDVITGWYIRLFDIPYMIRRMVKVVGETQVGKLSPFGVIDQKNIFIAGKEYISYTIAGVEQLDYLDLFKKFGYTYGTQENYKLDTIAQTVLGERKVSYEEYGSLTKLYEENHQLFIDYNIKDTAIIERIEDKCAYIKLAMTTAYRANSNFSDAFGTVAIWDNITYKYLHQKNIVIYNKKFVVKPHITGAFVKDPIVGKHKWVVSFDLDSLYPNLIIQYNMSPETITGEIEDHYTVDKLLNKEITNATSDVIAVNGVHFTKGKEGFIPALIRELYDERVVVKKEMIELKKQQNEKNDVRILQLDSQQMSIKILMNSLYGAMGNAGFRYFDFRIASAITLSGQLSIKWAEKAVNAYLQKILGTEKDYVIAMDTDSLYITLDDLVQKAVPAGTSTAKIVSIIDELCEKKILPVLAEAYRDLHEYMGTFNNRMNMKRENIADSGIWTGKKHYILNVHDNEGVRYATPKLKIMGIEAVKSSTPKVCRDRLKNSFQIAIDGTEEDMQKYIKQCREEFRVCKPEEIAFPRGISDLNKYHHAQTIYGPKTPIHVRGSLLYNNKIKEMGLDKQLEMIQSGDKIRFIYLKTPNPIQENVISFQNFLPRELMLEEYIDYDLQFNKAFLEPLKSILNAIGWQDKKQASLMGFFE